MTADSKPLPPASSNVARTTVVIPCYNEAARLDTAAFLAFADEADVGLLFVNDGSTDGTRAVIEAIRAKNPSRIHLLDLEKNVGKAEAVRRGLIEVCAAAPSYVGYWDADLATPLSDILTFQALLDSRPDIDMVFGSRVKLLGRSIHRRAVRHYFGRVFATAASVALGIAVYDTQCGAKLFRATSGFAERLREPFVGGWLFDVELIAREIQARRGSSLPPVSSVIFEYPLMQWHDVAGSKVRLRDWFTAAARLGRIYMKYDLHTDRRADLR